MYNPRELLQMKIEFQNDMPSWWYLHGYRMALTNNERKTPFSGRTKYLDYWYMGNADARGDLDAQQ